MFLCITYVQVSKSITVICNRHKIDINIIAIFKVTVHFATKCVVIMRCIKSPYGSHGPDSGEQPTHGNSAGTELGEKIPWLYPSSSFLSPVSTPWVNPIRSQRGKESINVVHIGQPPSIQNRVEKHKVCRDS